VLLKMEEVGPDGGAGGTYPYPISITVNATGQVTDVTPSSGGVLTTAPITGNGLLGNEIGFSGVTTTAPVLGTGLPGNNVRLQQIFPAPFQKRVPTLISVSREGLVTALDNQADDAYVTSVYNQGTQIIFDNQANVLRFDTLHTDPGKDFRDPLGQWDLAAGTFTPAKVGWHRITFSGVVANPNAGFFAASVRRTSPGPVQTIVGHGGFFSQGGANVTHVDVPPPVDATVDGSLDSLPGVYYFNASALVNLKAGEFIECIMYPETAGSLQWNMFEHVATTEYVGEP
jgi:hypothetical protein